MSTQCLAVGQWKKLSNPAPDKIQTMLLLSDGSVMAATYPGTNKKWYRLSPTEDGSYIKGTWSSLPSMYYSRLYFASAVLPDGRIFVAGGEYGSGSSTAEIFDPVHLSWTIVSPPADLLNSRKQEKFSDAPSKILPDGNILVSPNTPSLFGGTLLYNPALNTWVQGPQLLRGRSQVEASWALLSDGSILTVDPDSHTSERFIPELGLWVDAGEVPTDLYYRTEIGPGVLLPDGRVFFLGGTGHTAFYSPGRGAGDGIWSRGPDIPDGLVALDSPAAVLPNGKLLCAFGVINVYSGVWDRFTAFYEFDPSTDSFTKISSPRGSSDDYEVYDGRMLNLPDGSILYSFYSNQLFVYQPDQDSKIPETPKILDILSNGDGTYHLTGTLLNGSTEGSVYGDDAQMSSNYPIVKLRDMKGSVFYARTFNWSETGLATGDRIETTEFELPKDLVPGAYALSVVASGVKSDDFNFVVPVQAYLHSYLLNDSGFSFLLDGTPGATYVVESSGEGTRWAHFSRVTVPSNGSVLILDGSASKETPPRFYRVAR
jgi:hypothetical protein